MTATLSSFHQLNSEAPYEGKVAAKLKLEISANSFISSSQPLSFPLTNTVSTKNNRNRMSVPPELRVVCRRLTSTPVDDLPRICPTLVSHVLRCGSALSATPDAKAKDKTSETTLLLHKLRTHITTLLTGRKPSGRFSAICLIKAIIDVGGWESLRLAEPWIRGLISVLQVCFPGPNGILKS